MLLSSLALIGTWEPELKLAIATGLFALLGATVTAYFGYKASHAAAETKQAIGTPNGKGNVVEMNEKQLARFTIIEDKLDFISDMMLKHISTPGAHGGHHDPYAHEERSSR